MKVKKNIFSVMLCMGCMLATSSALLAQKHKGICNLEVMNAYTQEIAGRNIGIALQIRNNNTLTFDALEYKVVYRDGFDKVMGERKYKWQSGNIIGPIKSGGTLEDFQTNWVKGANKIQLILLRVHFTDGTVCK